MNPFDRLLHHMQGDTDPETCANVSRQPPDRLKLMASIMRDRHRYQPRVGDLVTWAHPSLKNATDPAIGEPIIITQILPEPVRTSEDPTSAGYSDSNTCVCGLLKGSSFAEFLFDHRRLKPWTEEDRVQADLQRIRDEEDARAQEAAEEDEGGK